MNRLTLLYKMDGLLNQCKTCTRPYATPEVKCKGCNIYDELRGIGNQLGRVEKMTLTKEKYTDLKAKGLTDAEIAKQEGVAQATISYRKKKWETPQQPKKETAPKPLPNKKERTTSEYESLKQQLADMIKSDEDKTTIIEHLEKKVTELEHLHCACDDLEKESARYREERNEWQKEYFGALERLKQSDSLVIQQGKVIENTKKTLENLTKENTHLKGLVLLEWGK